MSPAQIARLGSAPHLPNSIVYPRLPLMDPEVCPCFRLEEETTKDRPEFQFGPPEAFGTITGGIEENILDATLKILEVSETILPENKAGNGFYHPRPTRNDRVLILDIVPHCDRKGKGKANENGAGEKPPCQRCSRFSLVLCEEVYPRPEMRTAYTRDVVLQSGPKRGTYTLDAVEDLDRLTPGESELLVSTVTMIGVDGTPFEEHQLWAMNIMRQVLRLAAMHKHELLVLGSVACGKMNPGQAQIMASCWSQVLQETEFAGGWWRAIWFTVNDDLEDDRVAAFKKELQHKVFGIFRPSNRLDKPKYLGDANLRRSLFVQPQVLPQPEAIAQPTALPEPKEMPPAEISIRVEPPTPESSPPKSTKEYIMESTKTRLDKDLLKSKNTPRVKPLAPKQGTTRSPEAREDSQTATPTVHAIPKQNGENGT